MIGLFVLAGSMLRASNGLHATLFSLTNCQYGFGACPGSCVAYLICGIRVAIEDYSIQALILRAAGGL